VSFPPSLSCTPSGRWDFPEASAGVGLSAGAEAVLASFGRFGSAFPVPQPGGGAPHITSDATRDLSIEMLRMQRDAGGQEGGEEGSAASAIPPLRSPSPGNATPSSALPTQAAWRPKMVR
jgi:hypothetical protein